MREIHIATPSSSSEIRMALGVSKNDIKEAVGALDGKGFKRKLHLAPSSTASEIRKSIGVTKEDLCAALEALDG